MAVYGPKYRDPKTGNLVESQQWWYEFTFAGKRVREPAKTTRKTVATEAEKNRRLELEKTLAGMPTVKRENRINSVADILKAYETRYKVDHRGREQSILFSKGRLAHVKRPGGTKGRREGPFQKKRNGSWKRTARKSDGSTRPSLSGGCFSRECAAGN